MHHKHSETNADPHNATRGFFYAHVGWLLIKKHKDVVAAGRLLDFSDLHEDGFVMFQKVSQGPTLCAFMYIISFVSTCRIDTNRTDHDHRRRRRHTTNATQSSRTLTHATLSPHTCSASIRGSLSS